MKNLNEILLILFNVISFSLLVLIVKIYSKKIKILHESDNSIKLSYAIWFLFIVSAFGINMYKTVDVLSISLDAIFKINQGILIIEVAKILSLFIGLNIIWFILLYYISSFISLLIVQKRKIKVEIESDSYAFIIVKGVILLCLVSCTLVAYEQILYMFVPTYNIPFYH